MIDVHCHLNFKAFEQDYDKVIKQATENGVTKIINTGTKLDSSQKAVELAQKYDNLYAIVGVHPHHADKLALNEEASRQYELEKGVARVGVPRQVPVAPARTSDEGDERQDPDMWLTQLEALVKQPKVVGIGEIGLDYFRYQSNGTINPVLQKEVFVKQLELAHKLKLPLQIHNRHAGEDILDILEAQKNNLLPIPGMFHCFAGSKDVLRRALNLGFYIGFDGNITYKGLAPGESVELKELAKYTPLDRIVTETDAPYLAPVPHRGTRNEPGYVILIGEFLAEVKGVSFEEIDKQTTNNAETLFSL